MPHSTRAVPARALRRPVLLAAALGCAVVAGLIVAGTRTGAAPNVCATMTHPVYQRVNPTSHANLLTPSRSEADNAATRYGFTADRGVPFQAATEAADGLAAVHRLYNTRSHDFVWITNPAEIANAVATYGYTDQSTNFYAAPAAGTCTIAVYRYLRGAMHRFAVADTDRSALVAAGWRAEGVAFYAAPSATAPPTTTPPTTTPPTTTPPPSGAGSFDIAVYPDTQNEVLRGSSDTRFLDRTNWLIAHRAQLNLQYVTHTGDVVNWDTPTHDQYAVAQAAMTPLGRAGIPYSMSIGNHDSQATCTGGSACPGKNIPQAARDTHVFNQYFPLSTFTAVQGTFEAGKVDNTYSLFTAGGAQWMVLNLELWQRTEVIDWAASVVAAHPHANVIVVTHSYLNGDSTIYGSNGGYGSNSPQTLYDRVISKYANVKLVFSGHTGVAGGRTDSPNGNKVASFLANEPGDGKDWVSLIHIDTQTGTVSRTLYAPDGDYTFTQYTLNVGGMVWVH